MDGITQNGNIEQKSSIRSDHKTQEQKEQKEAEKQEIVNIIKLYKLKPIINKDKTETIVLDATNITKEDLNSTFYVLELFNVEETRFSTKLRDIYWESEQFLGIYNYEYNKEKKELELLICKDLEAKIRIIIKGEEEIIKEIEKKIYELIYNTIAENEGVLSYVEKTFLKYYPNREITGSYLDENPEFYIIETETIKTKKEKKFQVEIYKVNGKWLYYPRKFKKEDFLTF